MSRVRNALKLAENWEGKSVFTGQPEPAGHPVSNFVPATRPIALVEVSHAEVEETEESSASRPSVVLRWVRRWRKRFTGTMAPIPKCTGTTRRGLPCRAPAMNNGYCRMHGGARVTEPVASRPRIFARFLPARLRPAS